MDRHPGGPAFAYIATVNEELVVRPNGRRLVLLMSAALGFVVAGVLLISTRGGKEIKAGVLANALLGGGAALVLGRSMRHGLAQLALGPDGLRTRYGTVGWADIESVWHDPRNGGQISIRLRHPKRFMASVPPGTNRATRRFMLVFAFAVGVFDVRLRRYARSVRTFADEMRWNRETFGWDLAFATAWLDRPGDDFVELLERYRRAAEG